ncbi:hypothetical protein BH11PLA2_BH11PLA2_44840 [soil metagenome]
MPAVVPHRFLVRLALPCQYVKDMPRKNGSVELPDTARLSNFAELDDLTNFADIRLAWNEFGVGVQCTVSGKEQAPSGDESKPRSSDGLTLWLDTRDARTSHRASRYCHQFHFLPAAGHEPWFGQSKINRALQDAPLCKSSDVPFNAKITKSGYTLSAFLPANVLTGFDPEQHPRWGFYYCVRDAELGEQVLSVNSDFPYADDPSLWSVLELGK